jgi:hypothetical protein
MKASCNLHREPHYTGFIRNRLGLRAFIAYQGYDTETKPTITNAIEFISDKHGVKDIIYLDSENNWTGWNIDYGFIPLKYKGELSDKLLKLYILKRNLISKPN